MRTFIKVFSLVIMGLFIAACSDDSNSMGSDGDNNNNTSPGTISATLNGVGWSSLSAAASTVTTGTVITGVGVAGVNVNFDGIALAVADVAGITETTYTFPNTNNTALVMGIANTNDPTRDATYDPARSTATVEITSLNLTDGTVSGTFSGDLYKVADGTLVELRNGIFNQIAITGAPKNKQLIEVTQASY